jgi:hypothetical protein
LILSLLVLVFAGYVEWVKTLPLDALQWPFEAGSVKLTPTAALDRFGALKLDGATVADAPPRRLYLKFDEADHLVAFQRSGGSVGELDLEEAGSPPPAGLAAADLKGVRSDLGIGIGSSTRDVIHAFGPVKTWIAKRDSTLRGVAYRHRFGAAHPTCVQDARFVFDGDRVVGMAFVTAC